MATCKASDKAKKHDILKRIKYRARLSGETYINPGEKQVTFDHLDDAGYLRLCKKRFIKVAATTAAKKEGLTHDKNS